MKAEITIPLDLPEVHVLQTEINDNGEIVVTVESSIEGTKCRQCGREIKRRHGLDDPVTLRHLPILGRPTYIRLRPKRYRCESCANRPTTTQTLPWYAPKSPHTRASEKYLLLQLVNSTIEDVAIKEGIGVKAVEGMIDRHLKRQVNWKEIKRARILGLDEIALKKGHDDYVVLATVRTADGEAHIVAVLEGRKKETVRRFLESLPKRIKRSLKTVCTDLYEGFIEAVKAVLGHVRIVADRFHIAKLYRAGADQLRKQETKRLKKELPKAEYEQLKGAMWAFRKRKADVQPEQEAVLERLFAHSPELRRAYELREQLSAIFDEEWSKAEALEKIEQWRRLVEASGLKCYDRFLKTLARHLDEITNYFIERENSGWVEGFNNKAKVLKRRCYGIFNLGHFFQRLYLDLRGYKLFARTGC